MFLILVCEHQVLGSSGRKKVKLKAFSQDLLKVSIVRLNNRTMEYPELEGTHKSNLLLASQKKTT